MIDANLIESIALSAQNNPVLVVGLVLAALLAIKVLQAIFGYIRIRMVLSPIPGAKKMRSGKKARGHASMKHFENRMRTQCVTLGRADLSPFRPHSFPTASGPKLPTRFPMTHPTICPARPNQQHSISPPSFPRKFPHHRAQGCPPNPGPRPLPCA